MTEPKFGSSGFACEHGQLARSCDICQYESRITSLELRNAELENLTQALRSVLSEDGVKEYLSAYVMGVELIERARELEGKS